MTNTQETVATATQPEPILRRIVHGASWSLASALTQQGANLISSILVARAVGSEVFGNLAIIQNTVGVIGGFVGMGLNVATSRFVATFRDTDRRAVGRVIGSGFLIALAMGCLGSVVLALVAPSIATRVLRAPYLTESLRLGSLLIILGTVSTLQDGTLIGLEEYRLLARNTVIRVMLGTPIYVVLACSSGLSGAVKGLIILSAINCVMAFVALRAACSRAGIIVRFHSFQAIRPLLVSQAVPSLLSELLFSPVNWTANMLLVRAHGFTEVAILNVANQWRTAAAFLPNMLQAPLMPVLANSLSAANPDGRRKAIVLTACVSFATSAIVGVGLLLLGPIILRAYGKSFLAGGGTLDLTIATGVVTATTSVAAQLLRSKGKMWLFFRIQLVWALVYVLASWVLIPRFASMGIAAAGLIAFGVQGLVLAKVVGISPDLLKDTWRYLCRRAEGSLRANR